jgi:hypothetical protein
MSIFKKEPKTVQVKVQTRYALFAATIIFTTGGHNSIPKQLLFLDLTGSTVRPFVLFAQTAHI